MVDMKQSECTVRYCVTESLFTRQGFISYSALLQHQSSILHHQAYLLNWLHKADLLNWLHKADLLYNAVSHQTSSPLNKTHYYTVQSKVVDQVTHWCVSCLADRVKQAL